MHAFICDVAARLGGRTVSLADHSIWLVPLLLLLSLWLFDPFSRPLVSKSVSVNELSSAQRTNICLAAHAIDGTVLAPGAVFSFNARVGPRTVERGYCSAGTYIGAQTTHSVGGGICCLSSALYQTVLAGGLVIAERTAHTRPVHTVPPGLDATVWYGRCDLRFLNSTGNPVMIACRVDRSALTIQLLSSRFACLPAADSVHTFVRCRTDEKLLVDVFRTDGNIQQLVSRDLYLLPR